MKKKFIEFVMKHADCSLAKRSKTLYFGLVIAGLLAPGILLLIATIVLTAVRVSDLVCIILMIAALALILVGLTFAIPFSVMSALDPKGSLKRAQKLLDKGFEPISISADELVQILQPTMYSSPKLAVRIDGEIHILHRIAHSDRMLVGAQLVYDGQTMLATPDELFNQEGEGPHLNREATFELITFYGRKVTREKIDKILSNKDTVKKSQSKTSAVGCYLVAVLTLGCGIGMFCTMDVQPDPGTPVSLSDYTLKQDYFAYDDDLNASQRDCLMIIPDSDESLVYYLPMNKVNFNLWDLDETSTLNLFVSEVRKAAFDNNYQQQARILQLAQGDGTPLYSYDDYLAEVENSKLVSKLIAIIGTVIGVISLGFAIFYTLKATGVFDKKQN